MLFVKKIIQHIIYAYKKNIFVKHFKHIKYYILHLCRLEIT